MSEHVSQPPNYVFRALDRMDRTLTAASPIAVAMIGITSVYYVAFSYGLAVVGLLFGRERAGQVSNIRKRGNGIFTTMTDHLSYISCNTDHTVLACSM